MSNIVAGLLITLIGMGLVFASLALLWGLMIVMVKVTNRFFPDREEKGAAEDIDSGEEPALAVVDTDLSAQAAAAAVAVQLSLEPCANAAAAAVAVALSLQSRESALSLPAGTQNATTSPWQAVHRANRLTQRLNLFSRK